MQNSAKRAKRTFTEINRISSLCGLNDHAYLAFYQSLTWFWSSMTLTYHFISLRCGLNLLKSSFFPSYERLRTMSACSIKSIKCSCIISQCLPHNGSLSRAVPEEANKGPSLLETSQVIQKEPNTIFSCVCILSTRPTSGDFTNSQISVFSPSQVLYLKRQWAC